MGKRDAMGGTMRYWPFCEEGGIQKGIGKKPKKATSSKEGEGKGEGGKL